MVNWPRDLPATVTRTDALRILARHGLTPSTPTAWMREENCWDPHSTFDAELGVRETYTVRDLRDWLGY